MTCLHCSAPALIFLPGVAAWCKRHAQPMAEYAARRLAEIERRNLRNENSRRRLLRLAA